MSRLPLPTENDLLMRVRRGDITFPPLEVTYEAPPAREIDAGMRMTWGKKTVRFAAECQRQSSERNVLAAADQARQLARKVDLEPLVIFPFLDEPVIERLESAGVSGVDLCGNGVVIVRDRWYLRRTGAPNPFRADGVIKNVYRGASSVVARLFLARREFDSVQAALDELSRRGGGVTLATVSKVCTRLADELIIERKRGGVTTLRLLQPDKLLDRLAANYAPPAVTELVSGKLRGMDPAEFRRALGEWAERTRNRVALSGASSVPAYAVMARAGADQFYCTDVAGLVRSLGDKFQPADRFATVTLEETANEEVYFDRRGDLTASPVQTFLELTAGDKRDQETAEQVRAVIMENVRSRK
jgi:hypothetical protein